MKIQVAVVLLAACLSGSACLAANANNPYGNIDPRNDAGNDTGNSRVEALNQAQLNSNGGIPQRDVRRYRQYPNAYPPAYAHPQAQYPAYPHAYPPPAYPPSVGYPYPEAAGM